MTTATLTFDDEFNTLSLWNSNTNTGTWNTGPSWAGGNGTGGSWVSTLNGYSLTGNGDQAWYINSNYAPTASVQPWTDNNGILTITAAPASSSISPLINGYQYTSGQINTSTSFSQTYGFFEWRAELPAGQGTWPAFWLLPEDNSWPPEIDAMEMLGNNPGVYYTSVHSGTSSNEINGGQANNVPDTSAGYHTYGVDWESNFITYYFDGHAVYQTPTPAQLQNIPMFMIASLALGGSWGGNVDGTTPFPAQLNIDFMRAYSSLPSWIADGSDPTDVNHTPGTGGSTGGGGGGGTSSTETDTAATNYIASSTDTKIVLIGTAPQTVTANDLGDTIVSNNFGSTIIGGKGNDTLIAGTGPDHLTGNGGSDTFVFNALPTKAGQITDFQHGIDKLDLSGIFNAMHYSGTNPLKGNYLSFVSDHHGNTNVVINAHNGAGSIVVTTLDHVSPSQITTSDWIWHH